MASPPLQVEDQTDEDFFDKLVVDDDFEIAKPVSSGSVDEFGESDEAKAFANLSIADESVGLEDSGEDRSESAIVLPSVEVPAKDILVSEESVSLVSSNSFTFDAVIESDNSVLSINKESDSAMGKSSGSRGTTVKEVQWSAFSASSSERNASGFGSYSDFFNESADGSEDPFAETGGEIKTDSDPIASHVENPIAESTASFSSFDKNDDSQAYIPSHEVKPVAELTTSFSSFGENRDNQAYGAVSGQTSDGQDQYNSQYWESLYPGWRYDPSTGEWHQIDGYSTSANAQEGFQDKGVSAGDNIVLNQSSAVSYLQKTAQSFTGTVSEGCTTGSVSSWNQIPQVSQEYPAHMVFDPQYPGWYYDTIAQEWRSLESYTETAQAQSAVSEQQTQVGNASLGGSVYANNHSIHGEQGQYEKYSSQGQVSQDQGGSWTGSASNYTQSDMWQSDQVPQSGAATGFGGSQTESHYDSTGSSNNHTDQYMGFKAKEPDSLYYQPSHGYDGNNVSTGFHGFTSTENLYTFNQPKVEQRQQTHFSSNNFGYQTSLNYSPQPFQTENASFAQISYSPNEGRTSAGRPPHALVTFGFGGKLIIMKSSSYRSQDSVGGSISIFNLMEVVTEAASTGTGACDYFQALCQQSYPGPLVGGSAASKEVTKWIDDRIANWQSLNVNARKGELLRLLLSLLKISCQHYGKIRSPLGIDTTLQENDGPESAVAKLFASARRNGAQLSDYGAFTHCVQNFPIEGQIQKTAIEVENLLVSGRRIEALQCAQGGQLWGPALVIAAHLGEKFYVDTVKQMAKCQFVSGSPLRTLCLLIAGQPKDIFYMDNSTYASPSGAVNMSPQPAQFLADGVLDDWEENLAIITTNRTKDDELVITYLGDCLWRERDDVVAAHICYFVAESNFEPYSDKARLCLIGGDHLKFPRTYASPDAIQRTEVFEYSKVLGNSQFILLPFQPYKLIYAYMLAEVGKVAESLRYCQAILKTLKSSGRAPEVETWKSLSSSLEERIRTHQQGGFSTNLAPAKLVGKLFTSIDKSIHRMIGTAPPPVPSSSQNSFQSNEHDTHSMAPKVGSSQSTMALSSLMTSAEPISEYAGDSSRMMPNRSVSEPDFGRKPKQVDPSKDASSTDSQGKASTMGPSRFGRFGSQLLQKTMGWVSRSRPDREAKLGEKNKFYYDEKLKRWVEEGAEPPAEEAALPPPPTAVAFQNGTFDYNVNGGFKAQNLPHNAVPETRSPNPPEHSAGIPPIPPSNNQFSARGRMGVRARYVDTFNKGGGTPTNLFQSPSIPTIKPAGGAKFFVPTPAALNEQTVDAMEETTQEIVSNEYPSTSVAKDTSLSSLSSQSSSSLQRFASADNITPLGNKGMEGKQNSNGPFSSRVRAASWSGSFNPKTAEVNSLGEMLGIQASSFMPTDPSSVPPSSASLPMNGGSFGDDLHEVEL